ncbi:hypothetical protein F4859DRAFT_487920 [Xylaria cf. heliscus]|nr:hypothetical protein F4859DRAFT_487920 [Xylaria cf. heliscus]
MPLLFLLRAILSLLSTYIRSSVPDIELRTIGYGRLDARFRLGNSSSVGVEFYLQMSPLTHLRLCMRFPFANLFEQSMSFIGR